MAFKYHCSLKYNDTKILHTLPLYFLFYFPFSSKKKFPTKKYLAHSLEIKIKWPALCHLIINMFVFTGNLFFFFGVYEHVPDFCFIARRKLRVEGHSVVQGAYGPVGSQTPPFQRHSTEKMRNICQW